MALRDRNDFWEKILVRRFHEEIINNARFDKLDEILGPKIIWHDPLLQTGDVRGVESFRGILEMFWSAFPDLHITVENQIQETEQVVPRPLPWMAAGPQGRLDGDLMDIPATGKKFKVSGISIIRFDQGRLLKNGSRKMGLASCVSLAL